MWVVLNRQLVGQGWGCCGSSQLPLSQTGSPNHNIVAFGERISTVNPGSYNGAAGSPTCVATCFKMASGLVSSILIGLISQHTTFKYVLSSYNLYCEVVSLVPMNYDRGDRDRSKWRDKIQEL